MSKIVADTEWTADSGKTSALSRKHGMCNTWSTGASHEIAAAAYVRSLITLPVVLFNQGFASGATGYVAGLPLENGAEPALADLRIERALGRPVFTDATGHAHIEISGSTSSTFTMPHHAERYIKLEKLKQGQRSGDDKYYLLVYPRYRFPDGHVAQHIAILAIPPDALAPGGALEHVRTKTLRGQVMACIPAGSQFELTEPEFVARIEHALNRAHYDTLTPEQQSRDRDWHAALQRDTLRIACLNADYLTRRSAITLPGGRVARELSPTQRDELQRLGALNTADVIADYTDCIDSERIARVAQARDRLRELLGR
jgi:hypothetical protein